MSNVSTTASTTDDATAQKVAEAVARAEGIINAHRRLETLRMLFVRGDRVGNVSGLVRDLLATILESNAPEIDDATQKAIALWTVDQADANAAAAKEREDLRSTLPAAVDAAIAETDWARRNRMGVELVRDIDRALRDNIQVDDLRALHARIGTEIFGVPAEDALAVVERLAARAVEAPEK